jgi:hypothetical protein
MNVQILEGGTRLLLLRRPDLTRIAHLSSASAAILLLGTGCAILSRPDAAPKSGQGSAPSTACPEPRTTGSCEECLAAAPRPDKAPGTTCIVGQVKTAGDMVFVVQRASIAVRSNGEVLGRTFTDAAGHFVWCVPTGRIAPRAKVTITVRKPPFEPSEVAIEWQTGQHAMVTVAMEAEGLTD